MDPAQPCFKDADPILNLDKSDAPFVDIIHTNGRFLSSLGLGIPQPIGNEIFSLNTNMNMRKDFTILNITNEFKKIISYAHAIKNFILGHVDFYPNGGKIQPGCVFSKSHKIPLPQYGKSLKKLKIIRLN